jgi:AraC-like DNA-binding protein
MVLNYNKDKLEELLRSFYTLTGIRIVVFGFDLRKIAEVPGGDCGFCQLIRTDQKAERKCRASDIFACEQCRRLNKQYSYTCHAGLTETVVPIYYGKLIIGYLMIGQVLHEIYPDIYWPKVESLCDAYNIDKKLLHNEYKQLTPITPEQVSASVKILEACAGLLYLERTISLKEDNLASQINDYIMNNLNADLSVSALSCRFQISRSRLYKIVNEYYNCGVEQLTRTLRIAKAKELLGDTTLKVSEIAHQVGYSDYNYFIKVFKTDAGLTPFQYKKRYCYL